MDKNNTCIAYKGCGLKQSFVNVKSILGNSPPISKNSIEDARTPQHGEIIFNTMNCRSYTVQKSGDFQNKQSDIVLLSNQYPYEVSPFYTLQFLRYSPYKILKIIHPQPMFLPSINFLYLTVSDI